MIGIVIQQCHRTVRFCDTHENLLKTKDRCSTQLAKMSIDPKFVELTAVVFRIFLLNSFFLCSPWVSITTIFYASR